MTIDFNPRCNISRYSENHIKSILASKGAFGQTWACRMRQDTIFWMRILFCVAHSTNKTLCFRIGSDYFQKP